MAADKNAKSCLIIPCLIFCLMPIIGGIWFSFQRVKEKFYVQTSCLSLNYSILTEACGIRDSCYKPLWTVLYNTSEFIEICSSIESSYGELTYDSAVEQADKHGINKTTTCFYDARHRAYVQWDAPNSKPGLILMIVGLVLFSIMSTCVCYFFGSLWISFIKTSWHKRSIVHEHTKLLPKTVNYARDNADGPVHWYR